MNVNRSPIKGYISPLRWLVWRFGDDDGTDIFGELEEAARRVQCRPGTLPAIIFDGRGGKFCEVEDTNEKENNESA